jgi:hypothetical protein
VRSLAKTVILALWLGFGLNCVAKEVSSTEIKDSTLEHLRELRKQNVTRISEVDKFINKKIDDIQTANIEKEVQNLREEKRELTMRLEFLNRLILRTDRYFSGGDLRSFLEKALVEMAKIDATSTALSGESLWKFLKYSADAIHRLPEQKENVLAFLEGYMNQSVSNPTLPEEYLSMRNYTNGSKSETGKPLSREEVGALADRRIQEMSSEQNSSPAVEASPQQ